MEVNELCYLSCEEPSSSTRVMLSRRAGAVDTVAATKNMVFEIFYRNNLIWMGRTRHSKGGQANATWRWT